MEDPDVLFLWGEKEMSWSYSFKGLANNGPPSPFSLFSLLLQLLL